MKRIRSGEDNTFAACLKDHLTTGESGAFDNLRDVTPWDESELAALGEHIKHVLSPGNTVNLDLSGAPCDARYRSMMADAGECAPDSPEAQLMEIGLRVCVVDDSGEATATDGSIDNLRRWGQVVQRLVDGFWNNPNEAVFEDGYGTLNIRSVVKVPHRITDKLICAGEATESLIYRRLELMDIDPDMFNVNVSFQGTYQSTSAGPRRVVPTTSVEEEGVIDMFEITIEMMEAVNY